MKQLSEDVVLLVRKELESARAEMTEKAKTAGVGVGMLLAPASGEETRNNLSDKVHEFSDRMRDKFSGSESEPSTGTYGT